MRRLPDDAKLFATGLEDTYALTQEPAPNGINVETAYEFAVQKLYGKTGLARYTETGGLRDRTAIEVVHEFEPSLKDIPLRNRTEDLIEAKLSVLLKQIGQRTVTGERWPRLAPGFKSVWEDISATASISTAVISTGHTQFIKRFHDLHDISPPDFVTTDDDIRRHSVDRPPERLAKPSPFLLEKAHLKWLAGYGLGLSELAEAISNPQNVTYADNDPVTAGELAQNFGIALVHIDPANYQGSWQKVGELLLPEDYAHKQAA